MKHKIKLIGAILLLAMTIPGYADTARTLEKAVKQSIDTRQETQKQQEAWEARKLALTARYDLLLSENEALTHTLSQLSKEELKHRDINQSLVQEKRESIRIQEEMLPFLTAVQARLELLVNKDASFLKKERTTRLAKLAHVMDDIEVSIGEKFRKVMEALFIEAEYGNTIEVYQDKIQIGANEVQGNIFRLGRISNFFLSLDNNFAAVFNVRQDQWEMLDDKYIPGLAQGVEMAAKRRPVELIDLPLGSLAKQ
jgi:vacuolar-type H+-ATPase subunit I/STV1